MYGRLYGGTTQHNCSLQSCDCNPFVFTFEINYIQMDVAMCYKWLDGMDGNLIFFVKNINYDIFRVLNVISLAKVFGGGQKTDFLQMTSSCLVWKETPTLLLIFSVIGLVEGGRRQFSGSFQIMRPRPIFKGPSSADCNLQNTEMLLLIL